MEFDPSTREHSDSLKNRLAALRGLLDQTGATLDAITSTEAASPDAIAELERLQAEVARSTKDYLDESTTLLGRIKDEARKIEEAKRRAAMSEKRSRPARDQARIQELSEELTRDLRLERVDNAIKELLDFLADSEFFAANASTGRHRRLKNLQNALEKALQK